jgi:hypothetical protein
VGGVGGKAEKRKSNVDYYLWWVYAKGRGGAGQGGGVGVVGKGGREGVSRKERRNRTEGQNELMGIQQHTTVIIP